MPLRIHTIFCLSLSDIEYAVEYVNFQCSLIDSDDKLFVAMKVKWAGWWKWKERKQD